RRLEGLVDVLGPTPERCELLGSYWRRRALTLSSPESKRDAIAKSVEHYRLASEYYRDPKTSHDHYPEINYICMSAVGARYGLAVTDTDERLAALPTQPTASKAAPGFWTRVANPDAYLTTRLAQGTLTTDDTVEAIASRYEKVFASGSNPYERLSVTEHLDILGDLMPPDHHDERDRLYAIARRLRAWSTPS